MSVRYKIFWIITSLVLGLGTFFVVSQTEKPQDTRTRAATASATLSFQPNSSGTNPIQKKVGDKIALDLWLNPGSHLVSFVKLQINYDPTKLKISQVDPFVVNTSAFPVTAEGPILGDNTVSITLTIGADGTKAIQSPTKIGGINFEAIKSTTGTTTLVTLSNISTILSIAPDDKARESVLSTTTPATILIGGNSSITPGVSQNPSQPPTTTPLISGPRSTITFDLLLHGVGSAGDNPNPSGSSLSNKTPIFPQRELFVEIFDQNNNLVTTAKGAINYDASTGTFKGSIPFDSAVKENSYFIKIKTPRYLKRRISEIQKITPNKDNRIQKIDLIAGDTNNDNTLDILDYNSLLDCGYGELEPLPNDDANSKFNSKNCQNHKPAVLKDLNDDGIINSIDYNLFLRELSVQIGD